MSIQADDVRAPDALARSLTVISLILPIVPLTILLSTLPRLKPLLAELEISLPLVTQWMLAPWLVGATILVYGVQAVLLTVCARIQEMRKTRLPVAGTFLIGWFVFTGFSVLGILLPAIRLSRDV